MTHAQALKECSCIGMERVLTSEQMHGKPFVFSSSCQTSRKAFQRAVHHEPHNAARFSGAMCCNACHRGGVCLQDNVLHGSFLAELTKEVLSDLEASKYQHAEYRISIYGRKRVEWDILAAWIVQNSLCSDNVVWLIQVLPLSVMPKKAVSMRKFIDRSD